jgi:HSP20 family protein
MLTTRLFNLPRTAWNNPFTEFDRLRREMDTLSSYVLGRSPYAGTAGPGVFPLLNLTENAENYFVRAELPGVKPEDLDIQMTGNKLTITGERKLDTQDKDVRYHRREREAGSFSRIIELPTDVDSESVAARSENGVLTVTIPKAEKAKPRRIAIQ